MNGEVCCILGVCCPPNSLEQEQALADALVKDGACETEHAPKAAKWVLKHFDLAPKGSLVEFKATIARMARG